MKILMPSYFIKHTKVGGVENFFYNLSKSLLLQNCEVEILKLNNKIKVIATNSKNNVLYGDNKSIIKIKPPKIKVQNENGAGDALAGMMLYLLSKGYNKEQILKYSVACGSYYASGKKLISKKDLLKIKNISRQVILK